MIKGSHTKYWGRRKKKTNLSLSDVHGYRDTECVNETETGAWSQPSGMGVVEGSDVWGGHTIHITFTGRVYISFNSTSPGHRLIFIQTYPVLRSMPDITKQQGLSFVLYLSGWFCRNLYNYIKVRQIIFLKEYGKNQNFTSCFAPHPPPPKKRRKKEEKIMPTFTPTRP